MIGSHAKYTVVLNELLKNSEVKKLIDEALSTYPMYTPKVANEKIPNIIPTREELNKKLLDYYKFREIGFETVGRFIDELRIAMNEIMPYYNQLMFSQDQDFNIIYNVDYKRTIDRELDGEHDDRMRGESTSNTDTSSSDESKTSSSMDTNSKTVKSDTPQDELSITAKNIDNVSYANEVTWNKDGSTSNGESSGSANGHTETENTQTGNSSGTRNETEKTIETTKGNYGQVSAQRLIMTYRETILNIEQMIIKDKRIQELFMLVW